MVASGSVPHVRFRHTPVIHSLESLQSTPFALRALHTPALEQNASATQPWKLQGCPRSLRYHGRRLPACTRLCLIRIGTPHAGGVSSFGTAWPNRLCQPSDFVAGSDPAEPPEYCSWSPEHVVGWKPSGQWRRLVKSGLPNRDCASRATPWRFRAVRIRIRYVHSIAFGRPNPQRSAPRSPRPGARSENP